MIRVNRKNANGSGSPADQALAEYSYDALGRRVETVEYVDSQSGTTLTNARRTRHVFNGLETIRDYDCGAGSTCNATLLREFVWEDGNRFPEPIAMVDYTGANGAGGTGPWTYHYLRDVHAAGHSNVQTAQKYHAASTEDQLKKVQEASRRSLLVAEPEQTSAKLPQSAKSA